MNAPSSQPNPPVAFDAQTLAAWADHVAECDFSFVEAGAMHAMLGATAIAGWQPFAESWNRPGLYLDQNC